MAQISKGDTFTNGEQVTGARLNQLVDSSTLLVGSITDQPSITANTLEATDSTIVNDAGTLKEATIGDILNSNLPVSTSSITGGTGVDLVVTPAAGQKVDIAGNLEADDINTTDDLSVGGDASVTGTLSVTGVTTLGATSATSLTIGGKTPMTTQDNLVKSYVKYGSVSGITSPAATINTIYSLPTLPTIPADETWVYEFFVMIVGGFVNGNTRPSGDTPSCYIYNGGTLISEIQGSEGAYGGHHNTFFYSLNGVTGASYILKYRSISNLSEDPRYLIRLTKVKTSTLSDAATCI